MNKQIRQIKRLDLQQEGHKCRSKNFQEQQIQLCEFVCHHFMILILGVEKVILRQLLMIQHSPLFNQYIGYTNSSCFHTKFFCTRILHTRKYAKSYFPLLSSYLRNFLTPCEDIPFYHSYETMQQQSKQTQQQNTTRHQKYW